MDKKLLLILLAVIVGAGIIVALIYSGSGQKETQNKAAGQNAPTNTTKVTAKTETVVKETVLNTKPGPNLTRHSFEGDVKSVASNTIVLQNGSNSVLPDFTVKSSTNISKRVGTKFEPAQMSDIKVGSHVDLHMDHEDVQNFWIFRDIYILK